MFLAFKNCRYKRSVDVKAFRCYRKSCVDFLKYVSLKNSCFESIKLPLADCLIIMYYLFFEKSHVELKMDFWISKGIIQKLKRKIRLKITEFLAENPIILVGRGIVCHIDESMFHYRQKYHVGRIYQKNMWVFGIVDTSTYPSKYYIEVVRDRSQRTLLPIIRRICRPETFIWSDEWRNYRNLKDLYTIKQLTTGFIL
ncbi:hypothetical protein DMUE_1291 [Dictyocoela muelleri]|nr:hypothetical protein DMUE_1291 [Dictyocoela muelleri]